MNLSNIQIKNIVITASLLTLFAVTGAALVGVTFIQTEDDIKYNERLTLLRKLNNIVPAESYDNDLLLDSIIIKPSSLLSTKVESLVYRARKNSQNVAVVFSSIAPGGYNGSIHLLIGVNADGTLSGVRVVKHRETPGLGDAVESSRSDWILGFNDKSLSKPDAKGWKVKRDGGIFDQFTGATITPRAVVNAVHDALLYFEKNQEMLFSVNTDQTEANTKVETITDTEADIEIDNSKQP
jgi:electron transport complex protein RnfG